MFSYIDRKFSTFAPDHNMSNAESPECGRTLRESNLVMMSKYVSSTNMLQGE